ncbi:nitroreductase family protein [Acidobacteriota bacterium]
MPKQKKMPSHHGVTTRMKGEYTNPMLKLLIERASCRSFKAEKIPPAVLEKVFAAGIHGPSGGNLQPFSIIKIERDDIKKKLAEMCWQKYIGRAPVNLLFCIDWHRIERWARLSDAPFTATSAFRHFWISFQDTAICAQNICIAAESLGLGTVYIGTILEYPYECREMFQLPQGVLPVVLICLGYPRSGLLPRKKLPPEVVIHDEIYRDPDDQELLNAFKSKYPRLRVAITEERLEQFAEVCRDVQGEEFAERCLERVKEQGYFNPAQRYFGLHYRANVMPVGNKVFLKFMQDSGCNWFKNYRPPKRKQGGRDRKKRRTSSGGL